MSESEAFAWSGPGFYRTRRGDVLRVEASGRSPRFPLIAGLTSWGMDGRDCPDMESLFDLVGGRLVNWPPSDWSQFEGGEVQAESVAKPKPGPFSADARLIAMANVKAAHPEWSMLKLCKAVDEIEEVLGAEYVDQTEGGAVMTKNQLNVSEVEQALYDMACGACGGEPMDINEHTCIQATMHAEDFERFASAVRERYFSGISDPDVSHLFSVGDIKSWVDYGALAARIVQVAKVVSRNRKLDKKGGAT